MAEEDRNLFSEYSQKFEGSLKRMQNVSYNLHGTPADTAGEWGSFLLYRLCVNGDTLVSIWKDKKSLDHYAVAVLARSMIEAGIMLLYIMERDLSEDEWKLRRDVLHLHDCISRVRLFKGMEAKEEADKGRAISQDLKRRITSNPLYLTFADEQKERLLSGEVLYLRGLRAAVVSAGFSKEWFEVVYVTQSAFTHATPYSFYGSGEREVWKGDSDYAHYVAGFSLSTLWQMTEAVGGRMELHLESVRSSSVEVDR
jgi:Family of unknown function (DUF5677)